MTVDRLIDLSGKTAVITGGAAGIGKASARMLAEAGADVALLDINAEEAAASAAEIAAECGVKAIGYKCDVMLEAEQESVIKKVAEDFGTISILVNKSAILIDLKHIGFDSTDDLIFDFANREFNLHNQVFVVDCVDQLVLINLAERPPV